MDYFVFKDFNLSPALPDLKMTGFPTGSSGFTNCAYV